MLESREEIESCMTLDDSFEGVSYLVLLTNSPLTHAPNASRIDSKVLEVVILIATILNIYTDTELLRWNGSAWKPFQDNHAR